MATFHVGNKDADGGNAPFMRTATGFVEIVSPATTPTRLTYPRPMTVYVRSAGAGARGCTRNDDGSGPGQWDRKRNRQREGHNASDGDGLDILASLWDMYRQQKPGVMPEKEEEPHGYEDEIPGGQSIEAGHPTGLKKFLILLSGALPYIVVVLDDTIVATIIPVLVSEFQRPVDIGWYATAYFLPMAVLMPVFGKAYSIWEIKWLFLSSLLLLLVGSIACGTASSSAIFIAGRAIAGAGAAGVICGATRIIGVSSGRKDRTLLEAAGAVVMGACTVAGPILGGVIADKVGWRWAFLLNVPIALGAFVIVGCIFPRRFTSSTAIGSSLSLGEKLKHLDPIGASTLIGSLACLVMFLESHATQLGPLDTHERNLVVASGVLFTAFLLHESRVRTEYALIPRTLLRHRTVWACSILLFFLFAGFINFVFFLAVFFQAVGGDTAQQSAINLIPYVVATSVGALLVGIGVSLVGYYNAFFWTGGTMFVFGGALIYEFNDQTTLLHRVLSEVALGTGAGLLILANVAPCHTLLPEKDHSIANGFLFLSSLLGATLSLPISSMVFNQNLVRQVLALEIPFDLKFDLLLDPTDVRGRVPDDQLANVLAVLVESIRQTFFIGLVCTICCALATVFVPIKRLILDDDQRGETKDGNADYDRP